MKVAVIGGGIAGISAAWHLQADGREVHLFERSTRLGGHTHTHELAVCGGVVNVDTGFIVFNEHNYPNFSRWLEDMAVPSHDSDMSFAVRDEIARLEYGTTNLRAMLANRGQLGRRDFWSMWRDLLRFYSGLREGDIPDVTLGEYLRERGYGSAFIDSHIAPMCSALWSQPASASLDLSLGHVVEFMRNHRMLQVSARPHWRVVSGGSASYVRAFRERFHGALHLGANLSGVRREAGRVVLEGTEENRFDAVVLACHSDQALALLRDPSPQESAVLGAIPYQPNSVFLHEDASFMPRNRRCWSSWNVVREADGAYTITYWMNKLQGLRCDEQFFVTLNPQRKPGQVHWQGEYHHPHFTPESYQAQRQWQDISHGTTQFAGAYWGAGFHEDGFTSGLRAARALLDSGMQRAA